MNRTRILLADPHAILLEGLKKLIEPAYVVVGTVTDGRALMSAAVKLRPDVIIMETSLPQLNGLEACKRLMKKLPESKVIFLTATEDLETANEAIRHGASGYILKKAAGAELFKAIQCVLLGRTYISSLFRMSRSKFLYRGQ